MGKSEWREVAEFLADPNNIKHPVGDILRRGDLFDMILSEVEGVFAPVPAASDSRRLRGFKQVYHTKTVVQFQCRKNAYQDSLPWAKPGSGN
jgi:hypothetical protein